MSLKSVQYTGTSGTKTMADNSVINLNVSRTGCDFFETPSMEKLLGALIQSISDGRNVTVVSGVSGSGKSTLIDRLINQARSDWNICRIHARHTIGEKHILDHLNAFFRSGDKLDMEGLAAGLAQTQNQGSMPRPVIIVDDADKLTTFALDVLFKLKLAVEDKGGQIGIVLFAQPTIRQLLTGPSLQRYDAIIRTIDLPSMTGEQTEVYIDRWREAHGYKNTLQLSPSQRQTLHKRGGGLPGKVNVLLEQLVDRQEQQNGFPATNNKALPVVSGVVATAIVFGFVIAIIFWSLMDGQDNGVKVVATTTKSQPVFPDDKSAQRNAADDTDKSAGHMDQDVQNKVAVTATARQLDNEASVPPPPKKSEYQAAVVEVADKPHVEPQDRAKVTAKVIPSLPVPAPAPAPEPKPEPVKQEPVKPAPVMTEVASKSTPVVEQSTPSTPVPVVQASNDSVEPRESAGAEEKQDGQAWLWAQSGDQYTVQLAASLDSDAIQRFIKSQPDLPELHYVHIKQRGRDWYISLYGSYNSFGAAKTAVDQLPSSMRKNSPWIRRLAKLQSLAPREDVSDTVDTDATTTSDVATDSESVPDSLPPVNDSTAAMTDPAVSAESATSPVNVSAEMPNDSDPELVLPPVLK